MRFSSVAMIRVASALPILRRSFSTLGRNSIVQAKPRLHLGQRNGVGALEVLQPFFCKVEVLKIAEVRLDRFAGIEGLGPSRAGSKPFQPLLDVLVQSHCQHVGLSLYAYSKRC